MSVRGHLYPIRAGGLQVPQHDEGASYLSFQVAQPTDKRSNYLTLYPGMSSVEPTKDKSPSAGDMC